MATTSSTSTSSAWRRSVRRRTPVSEREEDEQELGRRAEELEEAVEELRGEKDAAEAEEAALFAELDAERGAAETTASETMLMIERLQREKAAALLEARQFRRLAEGRAERHRVLLDELASLSALTAGYLSILRAHAIDPDEDGQEEADGESSTGVKGAIVQNSPPPPPAEKELDYTTYVICEAATKAMAAVVKEQRVVVDGAVDLYARVKALEADRAATRREVASLRAEPARAVLAREMARRLCRDAVADERPGAVTKAHKSRFSVLAIGKIPANSSTTPYDSWSNANIPNITFAGDVSKTIVTDNYREWLFSLILREKRCSTARLTLGLSTALLGMLLLLERSSAALHRRQRPPRLPQM